jgi:hypothetical protein
MYECEQINQQLNDYYSFALDILNFLQKNLTQFYKALITYSIVLKNLHTKSNNLLIKTNSNDELTKHLYQAFSSLTQTFDDEYHQLDHRAKFLKIIQLTIQNLRQQLNSSIISKQKHKLHNYTYRIIRLNRNKKRQYLYKLVQQIRKHDKLTLTWKNNLDNITSETTNLLWKIFSYSPYKFDIKSIETSSSSRSIYDKQHDQIELGSGDQLHSKSIKENIRYEYKQEQQPISNTNNALIRSVNSNEKNRLYDDEDDQWINLVKQNEIQWKKPVTTLSTDQSSNDSESIIQQYNRINSLHLSDISCTTDYYSQNESD